MDATMTSSTTDLSRLFGGLIAGQRLELPPMPATAAEVMDLCQQETTDAAKLSAVVHRDQTIASNVLRVANSVAYAGQVPCSSLQQACSRLGMQLISEIATAVAVRGRMFADARCAALLTALWRHSVLAGFFSKEIARARRRNVDVAFLCGLLHDIGKAADHELEGGHPKIGADLLKRHGEREEIVHAALGHHDDITTKNPYTVLVATADACSASRPGARRESLERYVKRMEELESIALGFPGVEQAFAIQAGRELRVLASSRDTDDAKAAKIARDIAKAFEEQLTYPGEIKITVVREARFTEVAR